MNRIVFAFLLSVIFVKLINGQILSACEQAHQALANNETCADAVSAANDSDVVCSDTCRSLYQGVINVCGNTGSYSSLIYSLCDPCGIPYTELISSGCQRLIVRRNATATCSDPCRSLMDDIIENCDNATTGTYSNAIKMYCTPCGMAQTNLYADVECKNSFFLQDADVACAETCRNLANAVIENCDPSTTTTYSSVINTLCDGGTNTGNCETAYSAVEGMCLSLLNSGDSSACAGTCGTQLSATVTACESSDDSQIQVVITAYDRLCGAEAQCTAALQALSNEARCHSMDSNDYCSGTCRTLYYAAIDACPDNDAVISRKAYISVCGTGSGSGSMLKASAIITLLFVAMCALIF